MGDWKLLAGILDEVHAHSTAVGKVWLTVLFVFRMLVLAVAVEDVWEDEQAQFVCNTAQPGCKAVCYDRAFPISLVRFWMLQVVFVSAPSLFYIGHALYLIRRLEKGRRRQRARLREEMGETEDGATAAWAPTEEESSRRRRMERELRRLRHSSSSRRRVKRAPLRGSLLRTYVLHILTRSALEVCFLLGQCALYGVRLEPLYRCDRPPCPNVVDCYVSRPTEKSVFMAFMAAIAGVSLLLNALEIAHLGAGKIRRTLGGEEEEDEDRGLVSEPLIAQPCATSRASRQQRCSTATHTGSEVTPPNARPPRHRRSPAEVKPRDLREEEASSSLSSAHSEPGALQPGGESLERHSGPTHAADGPPSAGRESRQLPSSDGGKGNPRSLGAPPRGEPPGSENHLQPGESPLQPPCSGNHLQTPCSGNHLQTPLNHLQLPCRGNHLQPLCSGNHLQPLCSGNHLCQQCSLGSGAGLLFPDARNKISFLQARAPSESMLSTMSSSSSSSDSSLHGSEGSDELGSLHGDTMRTMAPPAGRRMSMSVFLDISSIMKK